MPLSRPDILVHGSASNALADSDSIKGGLRTKIADFTALTGSTFDDAETASAKGLFKAYSTIVYVTDARRLKEPGSGVVGDEVDTYTVDTSAAAASGFYVYTGGTIGQADVFTLTGSTPNRTALPTHWTLLDTLLTSVSGTAPAIEANSGTPVLATDITAAEIQILLDLEIGADVQAYDVGLAYLAGLTITDEGTFQEQTGLEIGVDVQAYDANIATTSTNWSAADITSGTLAVARGGTGLASYTVGDIIYASGATTLAKLGVGTGGYVLTMNSGATAPEWTASSGTPQGTAILSSDGGDELITKYLRADGDGTCSWQTVSVLDGLTATIAELNLLDGFEVTTSGLGAEANATNDIADLYGSNPSARSNDSTARSLGAIAKCSIDITTDTTDSPNNFAPVAAAANGYPIQHDLNSKSIYVVALKTHKAGAAGTGGVATALGEPIPIFCKYKPLTTDIVEVSVGITLENEKYDIIVIG